MSTALGVALGLFVVAYGAVAVYAVKHRLLARVAVREATRRPVQSLLVIGGLMVGTATITAGLVAADSVADSVTDSLVYRNFGLIDLTVSDGGRPFSQEVASALADSPEVAEVTDGVSAGVEVNVAVANLDARRGASNVTLVGFDPASQEPFGTFTLIDGRATLGDDLGPGAAIVSRRLAEKIEASAGDRIQVSFESPLGTRSSVISVAGVARSQGPGAYTLGPVVFAPLDAAQELLGTGQINVVRLSAPGGVRDTLDAAAAAVPVVDAVSRAIDPSLETRELKQANIEGTSEFTAFIRGLLVSLSALVMAGGAALIINLVGMLAAERRSRLGVLRALGLKRRGLVGLSTLEGSLYSIAGGVVGVGVGAAFGKIVADRFGRAFGEFAGPDLDVQFSYAVQVDTLVVGFVAGTLLTLVVLLASSRRTSRMTITAAIRNLPEPPATRVRGRRQKITLTLVALAGVAGLASNQPPGRMIGGILLLLVAASLTRARFSPRMHAVLLGGALAAWSFLNIAVAPAPEEDSGAFFSVFVMAMLTSVFGLTLLAAANLNLAEKLVSVLGRASSRVRAILRPPLAYMARRPVRTGLTTGVLAVIVGMLTLLATFYVIFRGDVERYGSGYDVRFLTGATEVQLPDSISGDVNNMLTLPTLGYVGPVSSDDPFSNGERLQVPLFELPDQTSAPLLRLEARSEAYATDEAAWAAVRADPGLIITNFSIADGELTLVSPDGPVTFAVAGVHVFGLVDGVFASPAALAPFSDFPRGTTALLDLHDPSEAEAVAGEVEDQLFFQGVEADPIATLMEEVEQANRTLFSSFDVLVRMGLVVGLLALGIIAFRIVIERRHAIGVLRSLGYKRRAIMAGLLAESFTIAGIGSAVGISAGVVMGYIFYRQEEVSAGFGIDWASLFSMLAIVFGGVLLLTVAPAWRAARVPPAEAVRHLG
jgi:putative ABC transport system permease protein